MKQNAKKLLALLLSLVMLCGLSLPSASAAEGLYSDTRGHWAEDAIERWSSYGIIEGYGYGLFGPDDTITRAQMAAILAKTLGLSETAENPFADVPTDAWYTPYVLRCRAAGIMEGDGTNAYPDNIITRQEAMTMLCRAFAIEPAESNVLAAFTDGGETADWAAPYVAALVARGIAEGVDDGLLAPAGSMTRAAMITLIDRSVIRLISTAGEYELTDGEGLILVAAGGVTLSGSTSADILITPAADKASVTFSKANVTGRITVQADGAAINTKESTLPKINFTGVGSQLRQIGSASGGGSGGSIIIPAGPYNLSIDEAKALEGGTYKNVTITEAVGDGEVTLTELTIKGDLIIRGGGSESIKLIRCDIGGKVIMAKPESAGEQPPRLRLESTTVHEMNVQSPAIIEGDEYSQVLAVEAEADLLLQGENTIVALITVPATADTAEAPITITVKEAVVDTVEAKAATKVAADSENNYGGVSSVIAEAPVIADSGIVHYVRIPEGTSKAAEIEVTGSDFIRIIVNSEAGAKITADEAVVDVSTDLEAAPTVTVNEAPIHVHVWDGGVVTIAPTCEETGALTYTCIADGCTDPAATTYEIIPASGHSWSDWEAVEGTDTHRRICANDTELSHVETEEHDWDYGEVTTNPTCTEAGLRSHECYLCGAKKTEPISAPGHSWGDWTTLDATYHQRVCAEDGSHIDKAEHSYSSDDDTVCEICGYCKPYLGCSICISHQTEEFGFIPNALKYMDGKLGINIPGCGSADVGEALPAPPMREGWTFVGWNIEIMDAADTVVYFGENVTEFTDELAAELMEALESDHLIFMDASHGTPMGSGGFSAALSVKDGDLLFTLTPPEGEADDEYHVDILVPDRVDMFSCSVSADNDYTEEVWALLTSSGDYTAFEVRDADNDLLAADFLPHSFTATLGYKYITDICTPAIEIDYDASTEDTIVYKISGLNSTEGYSYQLGGTLDDDSDVVFFLGQADDSGCVNIYAEGADLPSNMALYLVEAYPYCYSGSLDGYVMNITEPHAIVLPEFDPEQLPDEDAPTPLPTARDPEFISDERNIALLFSDPEDISDISYYIISLYKDGEWSENTSCSISEDNVEDGKRGVSLDLEEIEAGTYTRLRITSYSYDRPSSASYADFDCSLTLSGEALTGLTVTPKWEEGALKVYFAGADSSGNYSARTYGEAGWAETGITKAEDGTLCADFSYITEIDIGDYTSKGHILRQYSGFSSDGLTATATIRATPLTSNGSPEA